MLANFEILQPTVASTTMRKCDTGLSSEPAVITTVGVKLDKFFRIAP